MLQDEITKTQHALSPLIDRPQLKDKLLSKPPFRFLHDIVSAVTKSTGFGDGLYQEEELDSGSIKDKEAKLRYLAKISDCVSICVGKNVDMRGAKVVAGLEPEKTNQFLQQLACCASDRSLDFKEAVHMTLHGIGPSIDRIPRVHAPQKEVDVDAELKEERPDNDLPPASRAGARSANGESKDRDPPSRLGGIGIGISGLDEQIEACDGSPLTTRRLLEPIISRPKLSDKLLAKPPFRFLHDIISEVVRQTSFASGLYSEIESDSTKVTDKSSKIEYLAKLVKLVGMQLNTIVEARPTKIVSGLEPNNTNRLLQLLAVAASLAPNSDQAVTVVLASEESKNGKPSLPFDEGGGEADEAHHDQRQNQQMPRLCQDAEHAPPNHPTDFKAGDVQALGQDSAETPGSAQAKRSTRPTTARRRPPKYKEHTTEDNNVKMADQDKGSRVTIIMDGNETDDDNENKDDSIVGVSEITNLACASEAVIADGKSKLVREIQEEERIAAKRVLETIDKGAGGIRFGRIDRAAAGSKEKPSQTDLHEVQQMVQVLCRSTNPLGKCMDYIHEDVATMHKELERWDQEYKSQLVEFEREQEFTLTVTQPLELRVKQLNQQICNEATCARSVKARLLVQEEHITQLLQMVCTVKG